MAVSVPATSRGLRGGVPAIRRRQIKGKIRECSVREGTDLNWTHGSFSLYPSLLELSASSSHGNLTEDFTEDTLFSIFRRVGPTRLLTAPLEGIWRSLSPIFGVYFAECFPSEYFRLGRCCPSISTLSLSSGT